MVTMKNKQNLKNLFVEMAGKTTISSPQITDNIGKVVGYWPRDPRKRREERDLV